MTDLCATCQANSTAIVRSMNKPESEKSEVCIVISDVYKLICVHVCISVDSQTGWEALASSNVREILLQNCCKGVSRHSAGKIHIDGKLCVPTPNSQVPPGSGPDFAHYSFDFAQQVHYPHNPVQFGSMYSKQPESVQYLGYAVKESPVKSTTWLTRLLTLEKG